MPIYALKQCVDEKVAAKKLPGIYECRRLGVCPFKRFSGFRTYCTDKLQEEPIAREKGSAPENSK